MTVTVYAEPVCVAIGELMELAQVCGQSTEPAVRTLGAFILVRCQLIITGKVQPLTLTIAEMTACAVALADVPDDLASAAQAPVTH